MSLWEFQSFAAALAGKLVPALWSGGAAMLGVWFITRIPAFRDRPALRCWLWRAAYLRLLTALFWTGAVAIPVLPPVGTPNFRQEPLPVATTVSDLGWAAPALPPFEEPMAPRPTPPPSPSAGTILGTAWAVGFFLLGCRTCRHAGRLRAMVRSLQPVQDPQVLMLWADLCARAGQRVCPRLLTSPAALSPMLIGALQPRVILPESMLGQDVGQLELVLAHELAHARRRDLVWNLFPLVAQHLFFFFPPVWLAHREWRLAEEMACDEAALRWTGRAPREYGQLLLTLVRQQRSRFQAAPGAAWALGRSKPDLTRRMLHMQRLNDLSPGQSAVAGVAAGLVGLAAVLPLQLTARADEPPAPLPLPEKVVAEIPALSPIPPVPVSPAGRPALPAAPVVPVTLRRSGSGGTRPVGLSAPAPTSPAKAAIPLSVVPPSAVAPPNVSISAIAPAANLGVPAPAIPPTPGQAAELARKLVPPAGDVVRQGEPAEVDVPALIRESRIRQRSRVTETAPVVPQTPVSSGDLLSPKRVVLWDGPDFRRLSASRDQMARRSAGEPNPKDLEKLEREREKIRQELEKVELKLEQLRREQSGKVREERRMPDKAELELRLELNRAREAEVRARTEAGRRYREENRSPRSDNNLREEFRRFDAEEFRRHMERFRDDLRRRMREIPQLRERSREGMRSVSPEEQARIRKELETVLPKVMEEVRRNLEGARSNLKRADPPESGADERKLKLEIEALIKSFQRQLEEVLRSVPPPARLEKPLPPKVTQPPAAEKTER